MANQEQLTILKQGVDVWNEWRKSNPDAEIDLKEADLTWMELSHADLHRADLQDANLSNATLVGAHLEDARLNFAFLYDTKLMGAHLRNAEFVMATMNGVRLMGAKMEGVNFGEAKLKEADLTGAQLQRAHFAGADLRKANLMNCQLQGANFTETTLIRTCFDGANLTGSQVYGASVWNVGLNGTIQEDLIITQWGETTITVDSLEVAQFIYLMLNNKKIRDVLNTLNSKTVLILGRFSIAERKAILDALRNKLREYDLLPIVFDFERPTDRDFTETVKTLAGLAYFIIADVTNPRSSPLELQATVPDYQIPFVPIIQKGEEPFAMMADLQQKYDWVLKTREYDSKETLIGALKPGIIDPAVEVRNKLRLKKAQKQTTESLSDFLTRTI